MSIVFGGALVWLVRGTRFGKIVVSVINDREISIAVGINVNRIYTLAFTLGALCAALGAAVAPTIAVAPGFAVEVGVQSFAVIAIGGMGAWRRGPGCPPRWSRQSPGYPHVPGIRAGGDLRADARRVNGQA